MKIQGELFDTMKAVCKAVVEHEGGIEAVRDKYANASEARMLWDIWNVATRNLMYDDNHPGFKQNLWARVYPVVPGFDIYTTGDNINDSHIESALRKIGKELGLMS